METVTIWGLEYECSSNDLFTHDVVELLGLNSRYTLREWIQHNYLPYYRPPGKKMRRFPRQYYLDLAAPYNQVGPAHVEYVRLFYWGWVYRHGSKAQRTQAIAEARKMEAEGRVLKAVSAAPRLGLDQKLAALSKYCKTGALISVRISHNRYLVSAYVRELEKILDLPTTYEVMERLGIAESTVYKYVQIGLLTAHKSFTGELRFSVESIERVAAQQASHTAEPIRTADAAKLLGLAVQTLREWCYKGWVPTVKIKGIVYLEREVFASLKDKIETLNPEFQWLDLYLKPTGEMPKTWSIQQTMRHLGISQTTLLRWSAQGLVPSYRRNPNDVELATRLYPGLYFQSLKRFAGSRPVDIYLVSQYKQRCSDENRII